MGDPLAKKTISNNILERLEKCEREIRRLQTRNIRIRALDDLSDDLGLQTAGEFRSGNGAEPGEGFTGGRFGYPGFEYAGKQWFLVGVNEDELMVGLDQESGALLAANGALVIDREGINLTGIRYALRHFAEDPDGDNPRYGRFEMVYPEGKTIPALAISFQDGITGAEIAGTNRGFELGDFSQWTEDYELNGSWMLNTDQPEEGVYCSGFNISNSSYNHQGRLISNRFAVTGGKFYTFSYYVRQQMAGGRSISVHWFNATSGGYFLRLDQLEDETNLINSWELISKTFKAPMDALGVEIWIDVVDTSYGQVPGFMVEFDNFSILERDLLRSLRFEPDLSYQDDHSTRSVLACRRELPEPESPNVVKLGVAGNITLGTHQYKVSFVSASGETNASSPSGIISISSSDDAQTSVSFKIGPQGTIARKIYRTAAGGSAYKLLATINNNLDVNYTDNLADSSLGDDLAPMVNSTTEYPLLPTYAFVRWEIVRTNLKTNNVWLKTENPGGPYNLLSYGAGTAAGAKGDWFEFEVYLAPGKYTFRMHYQSGNGRGVIKFYEDNQAQFASVDMYASTIISKEALVSGVEIIGIGTHHIRAMMATKNPSSAGYSSMISDVEFVRE